MASVCLPYDALLQHLPSYLSFSYLGRGLSLHSCSSKAQPLLLTLDEGYLLTAAPPNNSYIHYRVLILLEARENRKNDESYESFDSRDSLGEIASFLLLFMALICR